MLARDAGPRSEKAGGDERLTDLGKKDRHLHMILFVRQKTYHIYHIS